jgi:hypothetical protein
MCNFACSQRLIDDLYLCDVFNEFVHTESKSGITASVYCSWLAVSSRFVYSVNENKNCRVRMENSTFVSSLFCIQEGVRVTAAVVWTVTNSTCRGVRPTACRQGYSYLEKYGFVVCNVTADTRGGLVS